MNKLTQLVAHLKQHFPAYVVVALIVINALIDNGVLNLPQHFVDVINAVLVASGMGVLHVRQQKVS